MSGESALRSGGMVRHLFLVLIMTNRDLALHIGNRDFAVALGIREVRHLFAASHRVLVAARFTQGFVALSHQLHVFGNSLCKSKICLLRLHGDR